MTNEQPDSNPTTQRPNKTYHCDLCPFTTQYKRSYKRHMKEVHNNTKYKYKCNLCKDTFNEKHNFLKHTATSHDQQPPYQCNICDKRFLFKFLLKRHLEQIHNRTRNIGERGGLRKNKQKTTNDKTEPPCAPTTERATINEHRPKITNDTLDTIRKRNKIYACDICSFKSKYKRNYTRHKEEIHDPDKRRGRYKCSICYDTFKEKLKLLQHITINHEQSTTP